MNKIIGNHKNIYGIDYESSFLFTDDQKNIKNIFLAFKKRCEKINKKNICEKTPKHVYKIDEMYRYVKNPKIIVMVRDGRDVVASLFKRYGSFDKAISRWVCDNFAWIEHPNRENFCVVKYEDFVSDPGSTIKKICDYIGIEYYEGVLNYPKNNICYPDIRNGLIDGELHNKLREYQINQDIYDGTGRYITDLSQTQLEELQSREDFMEVMTKLNYAM
jgi:hypothetical protein